MSVKAIERWLRRAMVTLGNVLLKEQSGDKDEGFALLAGSGTPTTASYGDQILATDQNGMAFDADSANYDAAVFVTLDGGTTYKALKLLASPWYAGTVTTPAADSAAGVAAREADDVALKTWVGPFTSPVVPRNVSITFESAWAGGDITITGTDQFGAAQTETIADTLSATVYGSKIFATVTGATNQSSGAGGVNHGATIGWGHKLGVTKAITAVGGIVTCDDASEDVVWDRTRSAFQPTNLPDGSRSYRWAIIG